MNNIEQALNNLSVEKWELYSKGKVEEKSYKIVIKIKDEKVIDEIRSALKKQVSGRLTTNEEKDIWICPSCETDLMGCYGDIDKNPEYCLFCGQKLDWSIKDEVS